MIDREAAPKDLSIPEAIDRLNSWVRSDSARDWGFSSPRYAIYDWKSDFIERELRAGRAAVEAIYLTLTCRDCGGAKRYTDSSGYEWPHCRKCSSTGMTRLEFVVTTVAGFQWHTPRERSWRFPLPEDIWSKARLSVDWEPNTKGRNLKIWEVAECLNVCEEAAQRGELQKPGSHGVYDHGDWYGESDHGKYRLFIGRAPHICELCGYQSVEKDPVNHPGWYDGCHHHVSRQFVEWCAWACDACRKQYTSDARIFDQFQLPVERIQHPQIQKWLERRGGSAVEVADRKIERKTLLYA